MARVKSVIARPPKVVQGLNIRTAKSLVQANRQPGTSKTQIPPRGVRPITPASIPLPSSPEPTSTEEQNPDQKEDLVQPEVASEVIITGVPDAETKDTSNSQRVQTENTGRLMLKLVSLSLLISRTATPTAADDRVSNFQLSCKTPISALLSSIQQGFDLTPCSPLSPAQQYASPELDSSYDCNPFQLEGS